MTSEHFTRNLLLVHNATFQALSDWQEIAKHIRTRAPDIDVQIYSTELPPNLFLNVWQVSRPSLVVSPRNLRSEVYLLQGGTVRQGLGVGKLRELARLKEGGLPVPDTIQLNMLDPSAAPFGGDGYVVVKPENRAKGVGVKLMRAGDLPALAPRLLDKYRNVIVQKYIPHDLDGRPTSYRVLTLFGRVLYCVRHSWAEPRRPLDEIAATDGVIATNATAERLRVPVDDADVLDHARRAAAAFPQHPVLGIDIVRHTDAGQLYVMEVNSDGRVWHLSSELANAVPDRDHIRALYEQFGALSVAADALIDATRELAG